MHWVFKMKLYHMIGGERINGESFEVSGPFRDRGYNVGFELPRFPGNVRQRLGDVMDRAEIPSDETRSDILDALGNYEVSERVLQAYAAMTGKPVSWIGSRLQDGLDMVQRLKRQYDFNGKGKTTFVSLPPNDPMEPYFS